MKAILRGFFSPMPKVGDVFVFDERPVDPFGPNKQKVEVIETYKGWVRYKFIGTKMWQDNRLPRRSFNYCYVKDLQ